MKPPEESEPTSLEAVETSIRESIDRGVRPFEERALSFLRSGIAFDDRIYVQDYPPLLRLLIFRLVQEISPLPLIADVRVQPDTVKFKDGRLSAFSKVNVFHPLTASVDVTSSIANDPRDVSKVHLTQLSMEKRSVKGGLFDPLRFAFEHINLEKRAHDVLGNGIDNFVISVMGPRLRDIHHYEGDITNLHLGMRVGKDSLRFHLEQGNLVQ